MAKIDEAHVAAAPTDEGFLVRVLQQGTIPQSIALRDFVARVLPPGSKTIVLDLSQCGYLDSTFLGCLVGLNRRLCTGEDRRFLIFAPREMRRRLFGTTQLDQVLHFTDELPACCGESQRLTGVCADDGDFGRHVMDAHRGLAELGGPDSGQFQQVADRLSEELGRLGEK